MIRGAAEVRAQANLFMSADLMKRNLNNAHNQWANLQRRIRSLPNYYEGSLQMEQAAPNQNYNGK